MNKEWVLIIGQNSQLVNVAVIKSKGKLSVIVGLLQ
jgi:hypothetical protein